MTFTVLFVLLFNPFVNFNDQQANKKKCDLDYLKGEWFGEFNDYRAGSNLMSMKVDKIDGCTIKGSFHWPDYFNTITRFEGVVQNDSLKIYETKCIQGKFLWMHRSYYKIPLQSADSLTGLTFFDDQEIASFDIRKRESLSKTETDKYKTLFDERQEWYGTTKICDESNISFDKLLSDHKVSVAISESPESFKMMGTGTFNGVEFPLMIYHLPPDKVYMEMSFQNVKFLFGSTGEYTWNYNPSEDKVQINESVEENQPIGINSSASNLVKALDQGFESTTIHNAVVDSIDTYRVAVEKGEEIRVYYLSKEHYNVIREELGLNVNHYTEYLRLESYWMPMRIDQFQLRRAPNVFTFQEIKSGVEIDSTIFEIPDHLRAKVEDNDQNKFSVYERAEKEYGNGNYERAIELYSRAIDINSYDANLFFKRGIARHKIEKYYGAISDLERAVDLDPNVAKYYNWRGLVKYNLGDYINSKTDFIKAIELDSSYVVAHTNKAFSEYHMDQMDSALISINDAIKYDSTNGDSYHNKGIILVESQRYKEGLENYKRALALINEDNGLLLNRIGVAHFNLDQYDSAIYYFKLAAVDYPDNFQLNKNLSEAYYYNDQYEKSIKLIEKIIAQNNKDDDLINTLGLCYYETEDYENAIHYFNQAIELNDKDAGYFDNRAYAYSSLHKFQEAIADFTTSLQLYPDDPEIYYQRGLLHKFQDNRFDACKDFKKAADMGLEKAQQQLEKECSL